MYTSTCIAYQPDIFILQECTIDKYSLEVETYIVLCRIISHSHR